MRRDALLCVLKGLSDVGQALFLWMMFHTETIARASRLNCVINDSVSGSGVNPDAELNNTSLLEVIRQPAA